MLALAPLVERRRGEPGEGCMEGCGWGSSFVDGDRASQVVKFELEWCWDGGEVRVGDARLLLWLCVLR